MRLRKKVCSKKIVTKNLFPKSSPKATLASSSVNSYSVVSLVTSTAFGEISAPLKLLVEAKFSMSFCVSSVLRVKKYLRIQ